MSQDFFNLSRQILPRVKTKGNRLFEFDLGLFDFRLEVAGGWGRVGGDNRLFDVGLFDFWLEVAAGVEGWGGDSRPMRVGGNYALDMFMEVSPM